MEILARAGPARATIPQVKQEVNRENEQKNQLEFVKNELKFHLENQ